MARVPLAFPLRFISRGEAVQTTSRELDDTGVFARCVEPPQTGGDISLTLYLPGGHPIETGARIKEVMLAHRESGFWAEFVGLSAEDQERVSAVVRGDLGVLDPDTVRPPSAHPDQPYAGRSRRLLPRFLGRFTVKLGPKGGTQADVTQAIDVNASGLFVQSPAPPELHSVVTLRLELPDGKGPAEVLALVVRQVTAREAQATKTVAGAGFVFVGASDSFRARFDAYLAGLGEP